MYHCNYEGCGKSFTNKHSLKRHEVTHNPDKKFKCDLCTKSFSLPQYLKEHKVVHTGERPFICKFPGCGKSFRQAGKLSIHRKEHSSPSVKPTAQVPVFECFQTCPTMGVKNQTDVLNPSMLNFYNIASFESTYCQCDCMNQVVSESYNYPYQYQYSFVLDPPKNYFPSCFE